MVDMLEVREVFDNYWNDMSCNILQFKGMKLVQKRRTDQIVLRVFYGDFEMKPYYREDVTARDWQMFGESVGNLLKALERLGIKARASYEEVA